MERLQKFLARAGIASRRASEDLILAGKVKVNGTVVQELGTKIDPEKDKIEVYGVEVKVEEKIYLLVNKPAGFVTTVKDPQGRPKVTDLIKDIKERVYPVGRLDYETEGLLIMTNDGDLAYCLTHPKYHVPKTYIAEVMGIPGEDKLEKFREGLILEDGLTAPAEVKIVKKDNNKSWLEITLYEGRKRQVRRMCQAIGHPVLALKRIKFGFLKLDGLPTGKYRHLTKDEVRRLKQLIKNN